jgi:recombination endonuclease VII
MDEKQRGRRRRQTEVHKAYQRTYQLAYYHRKKGETTPATRTARRKYSQNYRRENRVSLRTKSQAAARERLYGLTEEQFRTLLERQDWECAICRRMLVAPVVDHDHQTKVVRGLLCRKCNAALGLLEDNPELLTRAADYLISSWFGATSTTSSALSKTDSPRQALLALRSTATNPSRSAIDS